jgi:septal ring factor EnvC (AmiA/AmiB activator)
MISAVAGAALLSGATAASAQRVVVSGRATSLAEQQKELKQAKVQAAQAQLLSRQFDSKAASATQEADKLNAQAAALAARIQQSEADLRAGRARIALVNGLIARQSARLAQQQGPLVRLVAALQMVSRRPPVLALLQPGSLRDTVHVRAVFSQVLPVIRARTASLRADLKRARDLKAVAVLAGNALEVNTKRLASQRTDLQRLETQKRLAARGLASNATLEAERAAAMGERARDIGDLMSELEKAGDLRERLADLPGPELRPSTSGQLAAPRTEAAPFPREKPPAYRLPVIGSVVTGLGEVSAGGVRSRGIGIATQPGAQVVAPADGRIAFAGPYKGFGQIVIIDHGAGWTSLVTGMARITAEVGDRVTQGSPLGISGTETNPIVTIELRRQGRPVDAIAIMNARR